MDTPPDLQARLAHALAGQYVIDKMLGEGGMGSVFLGRDVSLDRQVAIKVITPDLAASHELRQRFVQEARTVARLRHPNIVTVYATGEAEGLLYFVMEFVPGESLRDRMTREKAMALVDAEHILRDLALALDHAHANGVVHRDVKPENVLLDRETGRAMLTDFGVARALESAGESRLTGHGFVLGSPRYMSPEQASGDHNLDGRSDLYSLGLIGYEMFSGVPAVDGPSMSAMLVKHLTERPKPIAELRPELPKSVSSTIDRALEKDPANRFARCGAFASALAGQTFSDATPSWQQGRTAPVASPRRRSRAAVIGAAVLVVAVAAVAVVTSRGPRPDERSWFVAPFEVQGPDRSLDWLREGGLNMLTLSLAQWTDLHVVDYERALDLLRDAKLDGEKRIALGDARKMAERAGAGRVVTGQVTVLGDSMIVTASLYDVKSGTSAQKARVAVVRNTDPRPAFESVATALLKLVGAPNITMALAKQTTSSVVAYRAYLEGLQHLNRWRLRAADTAFSSAIAADSTFALAYYKKSVALGWEANANTDTARLVAAERAVQLADRLSPRLQELVKAHAELTAAFIAASYGDTTKTLGGFLSSRARLARLVATDSLDAEASYALADADYHLIWGTSYGRSPDSTAKYLTESLRGFRRTVRIDSTFHLAFQHLVEMYGQAANPRSFLVLVGDTIKAGGTPDYERKIGSPELLAKLRRDAQRLSRDAAANWVASDPDATNARRALADAYLAQGQPDSAVQTLRQALSRPTTADPSFEWMLPLVKARALLPGSGPDMVAVLKRYPVEKASRLPIGVRFQSLFGAFTVAGLAGAPSLLDSAAALLNKTDPVVPGPGDHPMSMITSALTTSMKIGMGMPMTASMRVLLVNSARSIDAMRTAGQSRADYSAPYMAYLETGDSLFKATAERWNGAPFNELNALAALSRGDSATALTLAKGFPSLDTLRKGTIGLNGMRIVARARVVAALGDARLATFMYEAIDPARFGTPGTPEATWPMYVRSFLARARLYEQLGERDRAIASYDRFLTLWRDAEAPLQPQLREAREAIARLRETPSAVVKGATAK